jgi:hypothetical protein
LVRILFAALCVATIGCRDRGPEPRLDAVEPSDCYNDEALALVLRGSFQVPVKANLGDPSQSRLLPYRVQLVSGDQVIYLPAGAFRGPDRVETTLEPDTPPGVYTVVLTDPWGRSTSLANALNVRFRFAAPPDGGPIDIDPPDAGPVRAPPMARFTVYAPYDLPIGSLTSGSVLNSVAFDASGSLDTQTAAANLNVSWNFTGASTLPPWTTWTTTKTANNTPADSGLVSVVLAVKDDTLPDGDLGYAARAIGVASKDEDFCFVTTPTSTVDGATDCSGSSGSGNGKGTDGLLSLDEAVRIAGQTAGIQTIVLVVDPTKPPVTFIGGPLTIDSAVQIAGMPGAIIGRELIAGNNPISLLGVEVSGPNGKLTIPLPGLKIVLLDSYVHDTGIVSAGHLVVERTRFERCAGTCITVDGGSADLVVSQSSFWGAGNDDAIVAPQCVWNSNGYSLDFVGNTFSGFATAVRVGASCVRPTRIVHETFHANGVAVDYLGGDGHVLRNNIFTAQQVTTVRGCTIPFATGGRGDHLLYGNVTSGCIGTDPGVVTANPLYVSSVNRDLRLRFESPAVDTAPALGIDANGAAPNDYLGLAPDFGGRETY